MRQYRLPSHFKGQSTLLLSEKESHYLTNVLRLKPGTGFPAIDTEGTRYEATLTDPTTLRLERTDTSSTIDTMPAFTGPFPSLHLLQCCCKGKKDEQITRQATEIRAASIGFVHSRFCTSDLRKKPLTKRNERMEKIIKEAIQQSGSPVPTRLHPRLLTIEELPEYTKDGKLIILHQSVRTRSVRFHEALKQIKSSTPVYLLIGSEGGISDQECEFLEKRGATAAVLDTNILRAETASIYALAISQHIIIANT